MKKYIATILLALPLAVNAQNGWEKPQEEEPVVQQTTKKAAETDVNPDAKYLRGAVPLVNGEVCWTLNADVPGKSAEEIYDKTYKILNAITKSEGHLEGSGIALFNKQEHSIIANLKEWMVFRNSLLSLDRTRFNCTLIAVCKDGKLELTLKRITYLTGEVQENDYSVSNPPLEFHKAEGWITDDEAVNKKNTKLYKGSAKYRRKTIDRKDEIFRTVQRALKN